MKLVVRSELYTIRKVCKTLSMRAVGLRVVPPVGLRDGRGFGLGHPLRCLEAAVGTTIRVTNSVAIDLGGP